MIVNAPYTCYIWYVMHTWSYEIYLCSNFSHLPVILILVLFDRWLIFAHSICNTKNINEKWISQSFEMVALLFLAWVSFVSATCIHNSTCVLYMANRIWLLCLQRNIISFNHRIKPHHLNSSNETIGIHVLPKWLIYIPTSQYTSRDIYIIK